MQAAKKIIVVDDEEDISAGMRRVLSKKGYEVFAFTDGGKALEKLREWGWADLIILDIMMPKMDGFEALRQVQSGGYEDIPIIFVTAKSESKDIALGHDRGAKIYLTKPFKPEALLNAVHFLIGEPACAGSPNS